MPPQPRWTPTRVTLVFILTRPSQIIASCTDYPSGATIPSVRMMAAGWCKSAMASKLTPATHPNVPLLISIPKASFMVVPGETQDRTCNASSRRKTTSLATPSSSLRPSSPGLPALTTAYRRTQSSPTLLAPQTQSATKPGIRTTSRTYGSPSTSCRTTWGFAAATS